MILSGNIGNDATVTDVKNRKAINFDVAVSKDYTNSKGEKVERTEWVRAVIWRNQDADMKLLDYLKKGKKVLIEGEPSSTGYQSKTGDVKSTLNIIVKEFEFLN